MLWTLGTDRVFKNPQRRDKCKDIAVAQFWVRNARSWEECYLGKQELKGKSVQPGKDSASNVSFQGQRLSEGGAAWLADRSSYTGVPAVYPGPAPQSKNRKGLRYPQIPTKPDFPSSSVSCSELFGSKPIYSSFSFLPSI